MKTRCHNQLLLHAPSLTPADPLQLDRVLMPNLSVSSHTRQRNYHLMMDWTITEAVTAELWGN